MNIDKMIKKEIEKSSKSRYQISKDTGISQAQLYRFLKEERHFSAKAASILLSYFGYEIVKKSKKRKQVI